MRGDRYAVWPLGKREKCQVLLLSKHRLPALPFRSRRWPSSGSRSPREVGDNAPAMLHDGAVSLSALGVGCGLSPIAAGIVAFVLFLAGVVSGLPSLPPVHSIDLMTAAGSALFPDPWELACDAVLHGLGHGVLMVFSAVVSQILGTRGIC